MSILSNNPGGRWEVDKDWNCWEWSWHDHKDELIAMENRFMDAIADDYDFWRTELIFLVGAYVFRNYCPQNQITRAQVASGRLVEVLRKTMGRPGKVTVRTNPSGGEWVCPEYVIEMENFSFIFRHNLKEGHSYMGTTSDSHIKYPIHEVIPGYSRGRYNNAGFKIRGTWEF